MAYNLTYLGNQTGGNRNITVPDGTNYTSLGNISLPGRNYSGYGIYIDQNMLSMIENFASSSSGPGNPVTGQLWYDPSASELKYNISITPTPNWVTIPKLDPSGNVIFSNLTVTGTSHLGPIGNVTITGGTIGQVLSTNGSGVLSWADAAPPTTVSGTAPTSPAIGDMWYDSVNTDRTYIWNGTAWVDSSPAVGSSVATTGSGAPTSTTPGHDADGALYIDTSLVPNDIYVSDGSGVWDKAGGGGTFESLTDVSVSNKVTLQSGIMWDATAISGGVTGQWVTNQVYDASPTGGASNDF